MTLDDAFPRRGPDADGQDGSGPSRPAAEGDNQPAPPPAETAAGMTRAEAINIIKGRAWARRSVRWPSAT